MHKIKIMKSRKLVEYVIVNNLFTSRIKNSVKHLRWSFLLKYLKAVESPLTNFLKNSILDAFINAPL